MKIYFSAFSFKASSHIDGQLSTSIFLHCSRCTMFWTVLSSPKSHLFLASGTVWTARGSTSSGQQFYKVRASRGGTENEADLTRIVRLHSNHSGLVSYFFEYENAHLSLYQYSHFCHDGKRKGEHEPQRKWRRADEPVYRSQPGHRKDFISRLCGIHDQGSYPVRREVHQPVVCARSQVL